MIGLDAFTLGEPSSPGPSRMIRADEMMEVEEPQVLWQSSQVVNIRAMIQKAGELGICDCLMLGH